MIKKSVLLILGICIFAINSFSQTLTVNKKYFNPGEQISVHFTAPSGYEKSAWIGLIPSEVPHGNEGVNDQNDIAYKYLDGKTSGTFVFKVSNLGNFDFRMNDSDGGGREVASVSFVITNNIPTANTASNTSSSAQLSLQKNYFQQNENIVVSYNAPAGLKENAWIGIIPSNISHGNEDVNDQNDVSYQYLNKKTSGILTFKAPPKDGTWDLRMNSADGGGKELASISFTVGNTQSSNNSGQINQPALPAPTGSIIFDNWNKGGVSNSPSGSTYFYISSRTTITQITNYHWNNGQGELPGKIGIKGTNGDSYRNWNATGTSGTGGATNVNWIVIPNITLEPGVYKIIDSNKSTWSYNSGSYGCGFTTIYGK